MEHEIAVLRQQLAHLQANVSMRPPGSPLIKMEPTSPRCAISQGSEDSAVASLLDMAAGHEAGAFLRSPRARVLPYRKLGDFQLGHEQVVELFQT